MNQQIKEIGPYRATKDFSIHGSLDGINWTSLHTGTLPEPFNQGCYAPAVEVNVGNQEFQYILFTAVNYYGGGSGLQYLDVK